MKPEPRDTQRLHPRGGLALGLGAPCASMCPMLGKSLLGFTVLVLSPCLNLALAAVSSGISIFDMLVLTTNDSGVVEGGAGAVNVKWSVYKRRQLLKIACRCAPHRLSIVLF
jgi:hypothetical protein